MPNLRKNSTVVTYNDDAIYKEMEKRHRAKQALKHAKVTHFARVKQEEVDDDDIIIPDVVFAEDGRQFFPCLYCCRAFAIKGDQLGHMQSCNFNKTVSKVPDLVQPKPAFIKAPKNNITIKSEPGVDVLKTSFKLRPLKKNNDSHQKNLVQNLTSVDSLMQNRNLTVIKKVPMKMGFPKIKFKSPPKIPSLNVKKSLEDGPSSIEAHTLIPPVVMQGNINNNDYGLAENSALNDDGQGKPIKLYFTKEQLQEYHEMYKKTDMSKCTICYKTIAKTCWYRHLRTHDIEKRYECNACDKKFGRKDHRDIHQRTHINHFLNGV